MTNLRSLPVGHAILTIGTGFTSPTCAMQVHDIPRANGDRLQFLEGTRRAPLAGLRSMQGSTRALLVLLVGVAATSPPGEVPVAPVAPAPAVSLAPAITAPLVPAIGVPEAPAAPAGLRVRVIDGGVAIADAEVHLTDGTRPELLAARTDAEGVATFPSVPAGPLELWATHPARVSDIVRISDIGAPIELALEPSGHAHGKVATEGVLPSDATVQLAPLDVDHAVRTVALASDGSFAVDSLPVGRWRVEPIVPGFLAVADHVVAIARGADPTIAMRVQRAGSIRGTVLDREGAPVRNATLVVRGHGDAARAHVPAGPPVGARLRWVFPVAGKRQIPTNDGARFGADRPGARPAECGDGHCGLDLVGVRGTVVHAVADGVVIGAYTELRGEAGRYVAIDHGDGIETMYMHLDEVKPGLAAGHAIRAGDPLGTIGSTGFDPTRSPPHLHFAVAQLRDGRTLYLDPEPMLRHAVVLPVARALDEATRPVFAARGASTAAAAPDQFTTDERGAFRIEGIAAGTYTIVAYASDLAPGASEAITVASGLETGGIRVTLRPGTPVCGHLEDRDGPLVGATVVATTGNGEATSKLATTYTNKTGDFVLRALAGSVTLVATAPGRAELTRTITVASSGSCRREVFTLAREDARLRGRISAPDGDPRAIAIRVVDGPSQRTANPNASGDFLIDRVASGRYVVEVTAPGAVPLRATIETDRYADLRLELGGKLHAVVANAHDGALLANLRVEARGPNNASVTRTTDARGVVDLDGLAPGAWTLAIRVRGYAPLEHAVTVRASRVPVDVTLDLAKGAMLSGVVRDRRGARVAGAKVTFGTASTTTDADGNFTLVDVPVGAGSLEATTVDDAGSLPLTLRAGDERMSLSVELGR